MRRDTYHDYITHEEAHDLGFWAQKTWSKRISALKERSGALSVRNAIINIWDDPCSMVRQSSVTFDSRAWTGLD